MRPFLFMKVRIMKPYPYCPDGRVTVTAPVGEQELDERWAKKAIASGHAKAIRSAPQNKAKVVRVNKSQRAAGKQQGEL